MFTNGQRVIADGRTATYAGAHAGVHYVYTIAGLVPARTVIDATCSGAPRQLQTGSPLHSRGHAERIAHHRPRVIPLRRLAA